MGLVLLRRAPSAIVASAFLLLIRMLSAGTTCVGDCDETYNYWEPLHYLLFGFGFQTWCVFRGLHRATGTQPELQIRTPSMRVAASFGCEWLAALSLIFVFEVCPVSVSGSPCVADGKSLRLCAV